MEPRREEQNKTPPPGAERRPKRFRLVKLEERIAPCGKGGGKYTCHCAYTDVCGPTIVSCPATQCGYWCY